ncbi:hypothetical protein C7974DRAFT_421557 [Boeremia exigua]|uniref:uncharacterized protein n=1 Tax=Boeremia exigua TaxID=749465 RepID=UPI001E8E71DB|nr:uncharacterized protein C7974DRAFT_421557 [Boeremia exigua]KAH6638910.1 hypothetical protein C7974DRAFT_421557 [Boeremia exigua]
MLTRILNDTTSRIKAFVNTSSSYRRANSAEMTELTPGSSENLSTSKLHAAKDFDAKTIPSSESGKPRSLQRSKQRFSGWRFGTLNFAICASIVFLINLIVTIWGSAAHKEDENLLTEGECGRIKKMNSGLHILINVLSTMLLSGSNYCMQCLSAPTRGEIDKAHGERKWLDIGVPSLRNLRRISRPRLVLWWLLAISSLPLHLLYNSAVYASISTNSYFGFMVDQSFLDSPTCLNCTTAFPKEPFAKQTLKTLWDKSQNGSLDRLEPSECVNAYGTKIQSARRNLFVVLADGNFSSVYSSPENPGNNWINNTNFLSAWLSRAEAGLTHYQNNVQSPFGWICSGLPTERPSQPCINRLEEVKRFSEPWTVAVSCSGGPPGYCDHNRWPVDHCLSEPAEPRCRLHFSPLIAIIVTALNFCKALLMFYIVYSLKENPLMTTGDAVASFLDESDSTTNTLSLLSIRDEKRGYSAGAVTWDNPRRRWKDVTSRRRRTTIIVLFAIALIIVIALLIWGIREMNQLMSMTTYNALRLGFGTVDPRAMISSGQLPKNMVALALIANLPQVILSFLYFAYNGLFTAMLMGYEWTSYAHKRKGLRTSRVPTGNQRSTYFLQLPYRFGLPLVILGGLLHWLVSQSIFVVSFDLYDEFGEPLFASMNPNWDFATKTIGYSPVAMLAVIILGVLMVVAIIGFGYIPYKPGMPVAGSCSLAISAACHPEQHSETGYGLLSEQKLQWGVVSTSTDGIGHCAFSSKEVGVLVKGRMYS